MTGQPTPTMLSVADAAVERYLSGYKQLLDFMEVGGANKGQVVEQILKFNGLEPGQPWCAALASYVGFRSFMQINPRTRERRSTWPLQATGGCVALAEQATNKGILMKRPQRGDIFLLYHASLKRLAHAGVVDQVLDEYCITMEGNTVCDHDDQYAPPRPANAQQDPREGWLCCVKKRTFGPKDRFVRWTQAMTL